jgi:hypothetical protein
MDIIQLPAKYDKLTRDQRRLVRLEYIKRQNGKCWHCKESLDSPPSEASLRYKIDLKWFPEGFLDNLIHLQHNHDTGLTEGAVHAYCNAVLWQYFAR